MSKKLGFKKRISIVLMVIGVMLILVAIGIEVAQYPWRTLFGTSRDVKDIPDPADIVLIDQDAGISLEEGKPLSHEEAYDLLPGSQLDDEPPSAYILLGIMKIPKIEVSQYILEGTQRQMRYGGGHVIGSAAIGEKGNCVITAHRHHAFRYIDLLDQDDEVVVKSNGHIFTYSVYESFVVEPTEIWVLDPVQDEEYVMTMITCTPFMVSTQRLIVRARLIDIDGLSPEDFYANPDNVQ